MENTSRPPVAKCAQSQGCVHGHRRYPAQVREILGLALTGGWGADRRAGSSRAEAFQRTGGRAAEGGGLLNRYRALKPYRGFESLPVRHFCIRGVSPIVRRKKAGAKPPRFKPSANRSLNLSRSFRRDAHRRAAAPVSSIDFAACLSQKAALDYLSRSDEGNVSREQGGVRSAEFMGRMRTDMARHQFHIPR